MYLYHINYPPEKKALCELEMRRLFGDNTNEHYILSEICYEARRSVFFKERLEILCVEKDEKALLETVEKLNRCFETFKAMYVKVEDNGIDYEKRLMVSKSISQRINGIGTIKNPKDVLGVTYLNGLWYFGILTSDHQDWQKHQKKPQSYSQSLSAGDARSLVNIASKGHLDCHLIDPCCGVGTVLLEAMSLNHCIKGNEILRGVCWKANRNLEYFGYPKIVSNQDIHDLEVHEDVAILDIPYNLYSDITKEMQQSLIHECARIADELVLISFENLEEMLARAGFQIVDQCFIQKMQFKRYVYCCAKKPAK